jgi:methyl coenzyme M reductase subunit C-like uncharacterized protein (methanogenesis marker protein 7)
VGESLNATRKKKLELKCNQLMPLTLGDIKTLPKEDLVCMILYREIRFKRMQDEWLDAIKNHRIKDFLLEQLGNADTSKKRNEILVKLRDVKEV